MNTSNVIVIGNSIVLRGEYSSAATYYEGNQVTMCGCLFQALGNNFSDIAPVTLASDGTGTLANTESWNCVVDNIKLYNQTIQLKSFVDQYGTDFMTAVNAEKTRAMGVESATNTALQTEVTRATNAEAQINTALKNKAEFIDVYNKSSFTYKGQHIIYGSAPCNCAYLVDRTSSGNWELPYSNEYSHNYIVIRYFDTGGSGIKYILYREGDQDGYWLIFNKMTTYTSSDVPSIVQKAFGEGGDSGVRSALNAEITRAKAAEEALKEVATSTTDGLMSKGDKAKLDKAVSDITSLQNTSGSKVTVLSASDLDDIEQNGRFFVGSVTDNCPDSSTSVYVDVMKTAGNFFVQTVWTSAGGVFTRVCVSGTFSSWKSLVNA